MIPWFSGVGPKHCHGVSTRGTEEPRHGGERHGARKELVMTQQQTQGHTLRTRIESRLLSPRRAQG